MVSDIFNANIFCECGGKTINTEILRDGFRLRAKKCTGCGKRYYHPVDLEDYRNFSRLRQKDFSVKLRFVGNSFCVSIPREIISFQEEMMREMKREMGEMIRMSLDGPEKLSLYFSKKLKRSER